MTWRELMLNCRSECRTIGQGRKEYGRLDQAGHDGVCVTSGHCTKQGIAGSKRREGDEERGEEMKGEERKGEEKKGEERKGEERRRRERRGRETRRER